MAFQDMEHRESFPDFPDMGHLGKYRGIPEMVRLDRLVLGLRNSHPF